MNQKNKYSYICIILLSILLYGIPFQLGGYILRSIVGLLIVVLSISLIYSIWKDAENTSRITQLLWIVNSAVLFHFVLIYAYLTIGPENTLLIGLILGSLTYFVVTNYIKNTF